MKLKLSLIASAILLTGCLEVEDNKSNQELANAVNAQNEILKQQNEQNKKQLTIVGVLENVSTDGTLTGAKVELVVGDKTYPASDIAADGTFTISDAPFGSDYLLKVTSSDGSFFNSFIYGTSRGETSTSVIENLGTIYLSKSVDKTFSVEDSAADEAISGLTFYSYTHTVQNDREGGISGYLENSYQSIYDAEAKTYTIKVPQDRTNSIRVSFDVDGDKTDDFTPVVNQFSRVLNPNMSNSYLISNVNLLEQDTILLNKAVERSHNLKLRVSLIDKDISDLLDVNITAVNGDDKTFDFVFDEDNKQYVADVTYERQIEILVPSFSKGDVYYASNSARIYRNDDLQVTTDGFDSNQNMTYRSYNVDINSTEIDLVLAINETTPESPVEMVTVSKVTDDYSYRVFYSRPIALLDDSVSLIQKDKTLVIKGNASDSDIWLDGQTFISEDDVNVDADASLSLNNTKLTLKPKVVLEAGTEYQYVIEDVKDVASDTDADISNDNSREFTTKYAPITFDINSLIIDNNNYMNKGQPIITQNTAGQNVTPDNSYGSANLILPPNLEDIFEHLTIEQVSYVRNGTQQIAVRRMEVVRNGDASGYLYNALKMAENENVIFGDGVNSSRYFRGLTIDDGKFSYAQLGYNSLRDHTDSSESSVTFNYSYELKSGEVKAGTLKLFVQ